MNDFSDALKKLIGGIANTMETLNRSRVTLGTFDFIKGAAMLVIILAHMTEYYPMWESRTLWTLFNILPIAISGNTFFFLVSGYSFREKPVKKMLKQTAKDFLIPYLWVAVFTVVLTPIIQYIVTRDGEASIHEGMRYLMGFLFGVPGIKTYIIFGIETRPIWYAIYFILSLFVATNLLNLIVKIKDEFLQTLIVFLCLSTGEMLFRLDINFFCINVGFSAVFFCYIGYQFKKNNVLEKIKSHKWILPALFVMIVTALCAKRFGIKFVEGSDNFILDVTASVLISVFLFFISVPLGNVKWKILDPIKKVGTYTYWIMCIHAVDMFAFNPLWLKWIEWFPGRLLFAYFGDFCIKLITIYVVCSILKQISKFKYRRKMKRGV